MQKRICHALVCIVIVQLARGQVASAQGSGDCTVEAGPHFVTGTDGEVNYIVKAKNGISLVRVGLRVSADDGKTYAYSYNRILSDLFLASGLK